MHWQNELSLPIHLFSSAFLGLGHSGSRLNKVSQQNLSLIHVVQPFLVMAKM